MRFWPAPAPLVGARGGDVPQDLGHQIDEGHLVAVSALRLAVKNRIIISILRDGRAWNEEEAVGTVRRVIDALISEQREGMTRLAEESRRAEPSGSEMRSARSRRNRGRVRLKRQEADRLDARSRTLKGVVAKLEHAREDNNFLREVALRARDETLGELVQARLIPRLEAAPLTERERREAIVGVVFDLHKLMEERGAY